MLPLVTILLPKGARSCLGQPLDAKEIKAHNNYVSRHVRPNGDVFRMPSNSLSGGLVGAVGDYAMRQSLQRAEQPSAAVTEALRKLDPNADAAEADSQGSSLFDPANAVGEPPRTVYGQKTYESVVSTILNPPDDAPDVVDIDDIPAPFDQNDWRVESQGLAPATGFRFEMKELDRGSAQALLTSATSTLDLDKRAPVAESAMRYLEQNFFSKGETVDIDRFLDSMKGRDDLTTDEKILSRAFAIEKMMVSNLEQFSELDALGLLMHMHINDPAIYPDVIKGGAADFIAIGVGRHPNGSLVRIHHYPNGGEDVREHSHLTPISSKVIEGRFINEAYRFEKYSAEDASRGGAQSLFQVKYDRGQSALENMHVYGEPVMVSREIVEAGGAYQMPAIDPSDSSRNIFHAVKTADGTTTLFIFEGTQTDKGRSIVIEDGSVERIVRERTLDEKIDRASFLGFMQERFDNLRKKR